LVFRRCKTSPALVTIPPKKLMYTGARVCERVFKVGSLVTIKRAGKKEQGKKRATKKRATKKRVGFFCGVERR